MKGRAAGAGAGVATDEARSSTEPRRSRRHRWLALAAALLLPHAPSLAEGTPRETFAPLEAAGMTIGEIRVSVQNIFDTTDPEEDIAIFRLANRLHIQTRPSVIEGALLFKSGDPVSVRVIEETERILRSNRYLYDVEFRPTVVRDGVVDIEVVTRDTWSLDPGFSFSRSGGVNAARIQLTEWNLLGSGLTVSVGYKKDVDRSSNLFALSGDRVFGSWTSVGYSHATSSDGRSDAAAVIRPFYALDARWAAGISGSSTDLIESVYNAGEVASQYRKRRQKAEVFGGWSDGLIDGWVRRTSVGVSLLDDAYATDPGLQAPAQLQPDQRLVSPFVRFQWLEDRYERELNRNVMGRPEFFALGFASTLQLGYALPALGSSREAWLYEASVSRGFLPRPGHTVTAAANLAGEFSDGQVNRQRAGVQAQYYLPQGPRWLFYASGAADVLTRPPPNEYLVLGGENGLRGYPLRYQSGTRRALFTLEERFYSDLYLWRLFRIGGAGFLDVGRAWGGDNVNTSNPGWLRDAGFGLRIVSVRSAFSNVLHADVAFPLNATPDIKRVQFLLTSKTSF